MSVVKCYTKLLHDDGSQAGCIILLYDGLLHCYPLAWSLSRVKRAIRSTLAAETIAAVESFDATYHLSNFMHEMIFVEKGAKIEMRLFTDNKACIMLCTRLMWSMKSDFSSLFVDHIILVHIMSERYKAFKGLVYLHSWR